MDGYIKVREIISHRIFACDYYALQDADKADTDKLISELALWVRSRQSGICDTVNPQEGKPRCGGCFSCINDQIIEDLAKSMEEEA